MGVTKINPYEQDFIFTIQVGRAIFHPARFTIVQYLRKCHVGTNLVFQSLTQLNKATVSHHIKELQAAGLVYTDFWEHGGCCYLSESCEEILEGLCGKILQKTN